MRRYHIEIEADVIAKEKGEALQVFVEALNHNAASFSERGKVRNFKLRTTYKGKLIMMITKGTRDETFFYVAKSREKTMASAIENIKKDLNNGIKFEEQKEL